MRNVYLAVAIGGAIVTYALIGQFVAQHGWDMNRLLASLGEGGGLVVLIDVLLSSLLFWAVIASDSRAHGLKHLWLYILINMTVGLMSAFGLYLYARAGAQQKHIQSQHLQ